MSRTAVIVALLIVLVLGCVALFVTSKGSPPPAATGPLLVFDPAKVTELRMDYPDGTFQSVQRDPAFDWKVVLGAAGRPARTWPAAVVQAQSALRLLGNLTADRPGDGSISKPAGTLRIVSSDGTRCTLAFGEQRLGGKVLVEANSPTKRMAWIDAQMADMLVTTGPQAWRSAVALPGIGAEASRITMKAQGGNAISLGRVQGKWALREPVAAPADAEEINKLVATLGKVQIVDFCDKGGPVQTGLENPTATLVVETDGRDASGAMTTIKQTLTVGQAADMAGQTMVARLERTATGKGAGYTLVVIVAGEGLAAINTNPAAYVSKRAIQVGVEDVGQIEENPDPDHLTTHKRLVDGWQSIFTEGRYNPTSAADVQRIGALLDLLAVTPAETVAIESPPVSAKLTWIRLQTLGGDLLAEVALQAKDSRITVYSDGMKRVYPVGAGKIVADALPSK